MARDYEKGISKAVSQYKDVLNPDEMLVAEGNTILLTTKRLIQLTILGKIKNEISINEIVEFQTTRKKFAKAGPLLVLDSTGSIQDFGNMLDADFDQFKAVFSKLKTGTLSGNQSQESRSIEVGAVAKAESSSEETTYGKVVVQCFFGSANIKIYSKGFIQIAKGLGLFKNEIEELISIDGEAQITKKTGLGRAAAAVVTMGVNLASPNQRGNLILTITTNRDVHVLFHQMPFAHDIKGMHELISAGKAVIASRAKGLSNGSRDVGMEVQGLGDQLRDLVQLRQEGLLSDEEFELAKKKLLS